MTTEVPRDLNIQIDEIKLHEIRPGIRGRKLPQLKLTRELVENFIARNGFDENQPRFSNWLRKLYDSELKK